MWVWKKVDFPAAKVSTRVKRADRNFAHHLKHFRKYFTKKKDLHPGNPTATMISRLGEVSEAVGGSYRRAFGSSPLCRPYSSTMNNYTNTQLQSCGGHWLAQREYDSAPNLGLSCEQFIPDQQTLS